MIHSQTQQIVNGPGGPQVVVTPGKAFKLKPGKNIVTDEEQIARVRKSRDFGTAMLFEITAEDQKAIRIRNKKAKEADEEIKQSK